MEKYQNENEWEDGFDESESTELVPYVEPFKSNKAPRCRTRLVWITVCACVIVTVALLMIALGNATPKALQNIQSAPSDEGSDVEAWRGAFSARNIYEECYGSAVTVRLGRDAEGMYWSGFVIDSEGWIITSLEATDLSKRGKMFVSLNDGREYSVESIFLPTLTRSSRLPHSLPNERKSTTPSSFAIFTPLLAKNSALDAE